MRRSLLVLLALAGTTTADPAVVSGVDDTTVTGTMTGFGKRDALDDHHVIRWHADGARVTIDSASAGGPGSDDAAQIARGRAFEATLMRMLAAQTFAQDVPIALDPDQLAALTQAARGVTPQRIVVTWAGTGASVAHYRVYAIFALGSVGVTGQVTLAGRLDVDVARHALVDARVSAVVATAGLAQLDAKASAHLTRRYR